jgi:hypothetical protein
MNLLGWPTFVWPLIVVMRMGVLFATGIPC